MSASFCFTSVGLLTVAMISYPGRFVDKSFLVRILNPSVLRTDNYGVRILKYRRAGLVKVLPYVVGRETGRSFIRGITEVSNTWV
jgi:hypothetical protein